YVDGSLEWSYEGPAIPSSKLYLCFKNEGANALYVDFVAFDSIATEISTEQSAHMFHDSHAFDTGGTYPANTWTNVVNKDFHGYFKGLVCVLYDTHDTGDFDVRVRIDDDIVEVANPNPMNDVGITPSHNGVHPHEMWCWDTTNHMFGLAINFYINPIHVRRNLKIDVYPHTYDMEEWWGRYWFCADDPDV
ncbi:MAG: hypothetical protein ACTSPB_25965, partial [Candidatus Thorarchaeota archaeon]